MDYDSIMKYKWDNENVLEYAVQQAEERASKKARLEDARKMKAMGYPLLEIAGTTGLTLKEIEEI